MSSCRYEMELRSYEPADFSDEDKTALLQLIKSLPSTSNLGLFLRKIGQHLEGDNTFYLMYEQPLRGHDEP